MLDKDKGNGSSAGPFGDFLMYSDELIMAKKSTTEGTEDTERKSDASSVFLCVLCG